MVKNETARQAESVGITRPTITREASMATFFSFSSLPSSPDLRVINSDFASTELAIEAVSEKGRELLSAMFGTGAVSVTLPKSKGFDFERFVTQKGLSIG
jgi:hypothetical protein